MENNLSKQIAEYLDGIKLQVSFNYFISVRFTLSEYQKGIRHFHVYLNGLSPNSKRTRIAITNAFLKHIHEKPIKPPQEVDTEKIYLTRDRLDQLEAACLRMPILRFVFYSCLTGMRYNDIMNLGEINIYDDGIRYTSGKRKVTTFIPFTLDSRLESLVMDVISMPKYPNKTISIELKKFAKEMDWKEKKYVPSKDKHLEFYKAISFHTGRNTFFTLGRQNNTPDNILCKVGSLRTIGLINRYDRSGDADLSSYFAKANQINNAKNLE